MKSAKNEIVQSAINELTKLSKFGGEEMDTGRAKKRGGSKLDEIKKLTKLIYDRKMYPAIFFVFSKKDVELIAKKLATELTLTTPEEQSTIQNFYEASISALSSEDRQLPQVTQLCNILKTGVGLHHGGMLPILKEVVEILFQIGILKILVSTETFSMGVNMPSKCVVFSSVQKWDGEKFRILSGSEFVQMCGRAGRRGKDAKGQVICMLDETTDMKQYVGMLKSGSTQDPLISQFSVNYNMLLNSLILEGFDPENMVR